MSVDEHHHEWVARTAFRMPSMVEYWNYRDELCVEDRMVMKRTRLVIRKSLQAEALKQLHFAHQGIEKCKLSAPGYVFWAGINKDIEGIVNACSQSQEHKSANQKEPLMPHNIPKHSWHTLASDLFFWNNHT